MIRYAFKVYREHGLKPAVKAVRDRIRQGGVLREHKKRYASSIPSGEEWTRQQEFVKMSGIVFRTEERPSKEPEKNGVYYIFRASSVRLHPSFQYELAKLIKEGDAPALVYTDEIRNGRLLYKPDYAPDNLAAHNYMGNCAAVRADYVTEELIGRLKEWRESPGFMWRLNRYLCRRITEQEGTQGIAHLPMALFEDGEEFKEEEQGRIRDERKDEVKGEGEGRRKGDGGGEALVSILIPNCNHREDLQRCIESILFLTAYKNYEILVIENNSTEKAIFDYYRELEEGCFAPARVRILRCQEAAGSFNYSALNNFAAAQAKGELLLLLNNDTKVIEPEWLGSMARYALRENTGAVGACLLYGDKTVQHSGIVVGVGPDNTAVHPNAGVPFEQPGYRDSIHHVQNYSAVTGACLMVRRSVYEAAGGLDEELAVAYNDVDFCLKLRRMGLLNVYTPEALLYHYESSSRGRDASGERHERFLREAELFRRRWREVLAAGDPYYNPNLSKDTPWGLKRPE